MLMVKPALAYLDVIKTVRESSDLPLCAYNVSGGIQHGQSGLDSSAGSEQRVVMETLTGDQAAPEPT